jgi:hypothetical protein
MEPNINKLSGSLFGYIQTFVTATSFAQNETEWLP